MSSIKFYIYLTHLYMYAQFTHVAIVNQTF